MLTKKHKLIELKTRALVDSLYVGNYKTNKKGIGIEFIDYREYNFSDDSKNIDFVKSEIDGKTLVKLYEENRELSVYFIFDLNKSFLERYFSKKTKYDILLEIFIMIGMSVIKSQDKVGSVFGIKKSRFFYAKRGKQNFVNILGELEKEIFKLNKKERFLDKIFKKANIFNQNNLEYFNSLKIKNSLVFYLTDKIDINLKDLKIVSSKNDLIFCNIFNSFENELNGKGIIKIDDLGINLDLSNKKKIEEYKEIRKEKIENLRKNIIKFSGKYLFFDEKTDIFKQFYKLFKK